MQIFLTVSPDQIQKASRYTRRLAHAAYRVGPEGRLLRQNQLSQVKGGLMVLEDKDCGTIRDQDALCREVWRECVSRGFSGVVADFEQSVSEDRTAFLLALSQLCARGSRRLYVPESYGPLLPLAHVLICTALSGGILQQRLEDAVRRFGSGRLALDLQRLRMDFPLPCPSGEGLSLTRESLDALIAEKNPTVFYSSDLCARYFTCLQEKESHFILFDDGGTITRKIQTGNALGIPTGFLLYPEAEDLLPQLFSRQGNGSPQRS